VNAPGTALVYSSHLGGSGGSRGHGIAVGGAGSTHVTGEAGSNFPTTAGAFRTTPGGGLVAKFAAASPSFAVSGFPSPTAAGVAGTFTVTALSADGTVNAGYAGTVRFSGSGPQAVPPADCTFTAAVLGVPAFTATPKTAGSAFALTLTAKDAYGNTATGYAGTAHFTGTGAKAVPPANCTFTSTDAGQHAFSVTLRTADSQSLAAAGTATSGIASTAKGIVVNPAAAAKFILSAPSSGTHGVAFGPTLTVEDAHGNVVAGYTGTAHFKRSDGTATLPADYTFTAADAGAHTLVNAAALRREGQAGHHGRRHAGQRPDRHRQRQRRPRPVPGALAGDGSGAAALRAPPPSTAAAARRRAGGRRRRGWCGRGSRPSVSPSAAPPQPTSRP
jgi:hypothetical protein